MPSGGFIVAGYAGGNGGNVHHHAGINAADYWIVRLSNSGHIKWSKCYGSLYDDIAYNLQNTPNGGFIIAGSASGGNGEVTG